jgi:hypothetical protein
LVALPEALTIVEWPLGLKNAFMQLYEPLIQVRLVTSVDDAKNCEEPDMPILASVTWGLL